MLLKLRSILTPAIIACIGLLGLALYQASIGDYPDAVGAGFAALGAAGIKVTGLDVASLQKAVGALQYAHLAGATAGTPRPFCPGPDSWYATAGPKVGAPLPPGASRVGLDVPADGSEHRLTETEGPPSPGVRDLEPRAMAIAVEVVKGVLDRAIERAGATPEQAAAARSEAAAIAADAGPMAFLNNAAALRLAIEPPEKLGPR